MANPVLVHAHIDVAGVLRWPKRQLRGMFCSSEGKRLSADECRDVLLEHLAQGRRAIPFGPACDGFDYNGGGCPGHNQEPADG